MQGPQSTYASTRDSRRRSRSPPAGGGACSVCQLCCNFAASSWLTHPNASHPNVTQTPRSWAYGGSSGRRRCSPAPLRRRLEREVISNGHTHDKIR
eukprot:scaffold71342_cov65-Phaeocystis_antarctica.AAC.3